MAVHQEWGLFPRLKAPTKKVVTHTGDNLNFLFKQAFKKIPELLEKCCKILPEHKYAPFGFLDIAVIVDHNVFLLLFCSFIIYAC